MKEFVAIQDYLFEADALSQWHEDSETAADNLNIALHFIYERSDENIESNQLIERIENAIALLSHDEYLTDFEDTEEISDWVEQFLNEQL